MKKQYLTDDEVRRLWKHKDVTPKKMILILSQLDACEYSTMRDRLEGLGLIKEGDYTNPHGGKHRWGAGEIGELIRMKTHGFSNKEIAEALGRSEEAVCTCYSKLKVRGGSV